jgi:hypothetical protein
MVLFANRSSVSYLVDIHDKTLRAQMRDPRAAAGALRIFVHLNNLAGDWSWSKGFLRPRLGSPPAHTNRYSDHDCDNT